MVLQCQHCGKKFFLKLGEQEWLQRHAKHGIRPNRCVECEEYLLEHPVSTALDTRAGKLRMHTKERYIMQSFTVPAPAKQLSLPRAELGSEHTGILWQRFQLGRTTVNRLHDNVMKGETHLFLDRSVNLPDGLLSAGTTITIAHATRNLVHFDKATNRATIDVSFPKRLASGSEYVIFRSSDIDSGLPAPLCVDDHNVWKKRKRELETWRRLVEEEKRIPRETREEQSKLVLDKWGPPCRASPANYDDLAPTRHRFRFNCQVFTTAIQRFAYRGSELITYPDSKVRTITLACFMGLHEGLGHRSVLYHLHDDPWILDTILSLVFDKAPALPRWELLKTISNAISSSVSRPCALVVADVDDAALAGQKAKERQEERKRLRQLGKQARPTSTVGSLHSQRMNTKSLGSESLDNLARYDMLRSPMGGAFPSRSSQNSANTTQASPFSPALNSTTKLSSMAHSSTNEKFFGQQQSQGLGSSPVHPPPPLESSHDGGQLKAQVLGVMNMRFQQMSVGNALKREVANRPERLFVCDDEEHCLKVFLVDGQLDRTIGKDIIRVPGGVAVTSDGQVFVTDVWMHKVHVFNLVGKLLFQFGGFGKDPGFFSCPRGICAGPQGQIFVCDSHNHRIQVFTRAGKPLRSIGSQGTGPGFFDEPTCVAVDPKGRMAISEGGNARVQIFDVHGRSERVVKNLYWGDDAPPSTFLEADQSGTVEELGMPMGVCFTEDGRLWVTDIYYHRILLFDREMHPLMKFGAGGGWGAVQPWTEPFRMLVIIL